MNAGFAKATMVSLVVGVLSTSLQTSAFADSKAIKTLAKKGGLLDSDAKNGADYVRRETDPHNLDDGDTLNAARNKDLAKGVAAAGLAATNVPGSIYKGKPGILSTIWFGIKSLLGLASGGSNTTPTDKYVGFAHGVAIADAATVQYNGVPVALTDSLTVPYRYASFTDSFGSAQVALYDFDLRVTSSLLDITGQPFLAEGTGLIVSEPLLDLSPEFGYPVDQYQLISIHDVPAGASGTYTVHVEGWAAADVVPEPSPIWLSLAGLSVLVVVSRARGSSSGMSTA